MLLRLTFAVIVTFSASQAWAWNALGHKVTAEIAWRELEPATHQVIVDTLRSHPRFDPDFAAKMSDDVLRAHKAVHDRPSWPGRLSPNIYSHTELNTCRPMLQWPTALERRWHLTMKLQCTGLARFAV